MIRNWLANFMVGRYGPDQLNLAVILLALVVGIVAQITGLGVLTIISYVLLFFAIFRMLSWNIVRRRAENDRFLKFWSPVKVKITSFIRRAKDNKNYHFFKCPSCKNTLRVPKGKGKIQITCPRCGERFIKKS